MTSTAPASSRIDEHEDLSGRGHTQLDRAEADESSTTWRYRVNVGRREMERLLCVVAGH
ncbi:MAG TPA: hypothetical protein VI699_09940 [Candidatus Acidoferrales bacterium]|nr:hypothetical protein [Candidatus Acidoferrales bacterium]